MEPALYVGRKVSKLVLKSLLAAAFGKSRDQGIDIAVPRLLFLHGADGSGKSAIIDICMQSVAELGATNGKPAVSALVDLDVARFRSGLVPSTAASMLDAVFKAASGAHERIASQLAPFERSRLKIEDIKWRKQALIDTEWPRELFSASPAEAADGSPQSSAEARYSAWIEKKIDPADMALVASADESLTTLLADCLVHASQKVPFALIFDSLELAGSEVEFWLRDTFLPLLVSRDSGIAIIISGSHDWVRRFRNAFPERLVFSCPLSALSLTLADIAELASTRGVALAAPQTVEIELATAGAPIAVQSFIDYAAMKVPIADLLPGETDAPDTDLLIDKLADRFLRQGDDASRSRIFSLALCHRFDKNLLSKLWGIPAGEVAPAVADLAGRYSFLQPGGRLHEAFRLRLRRHLIAELARGGDSQLAAFFKPFSAVLVEHHVTELERKVTQMPDPLERYADYKFQGALMGYRYALAISSSHELVRALPGLFIEALMYNARFAAQLLEFEKELEPLLPEELHLLVNQLRPGLLIVEEAFSPIIPGKRANPRGLSFMENVRSTLGDSQRALLHRLRGKLQSHAGNFTKAVEEFETGMRLLGDGVASRSALFGDFTASGYAFIKAGDTARAVAAFSRAAALKSDDYGARLELARMQQSMNDHRAAIESFEAAVAIDPEAGDAWFELGIESALLSEHARAVEAFTRVTKLDAKHVGAWFNCAVSLEALSKFSEAQEAANKAVALVPDHWEALCVLGRALAAQYYSREAIDAFNKVVAIKPDCTTAWESLGRQLLVIESFENAASALEKAAQLDEKREELWHAIGMAWYGAAQYANSVQACRKATALRKDDFDAWVTLGHALTGMKDYRNAAAAFRNAADLRPDDRQIWVNVGNSLLAQEEFQAAIDAFLKATELRSDTDAVWLSIGKAFQAQKKHTEAVDSFQKSIAINPDIAEGWFLQGRSCAALGWYDDAAACFTKTVDLTPDAGEAWYHRGLAQSASGNPAEAIASILKATTIIPSDAEVWFQLGLAHTAAGDAGSAADAFLKSIACDDDRPEAHHQLGLARESLGRYDEAIDSFRKALSLSPDRMDSLLRMGLCCNVLGRYTEAAEALHKVCEIDPRTTEALLPLALASHALGNYADAVELYRKVIALKPDSEEAQYNLALALHAMNNFTEAFEAYLTVVRKWPAKDDAWYNLGLAYAAVQDYPQAISAFREASRLNPESPDIWFELGTVYYTTEQYGEAILSFRKVIAFNPSMFEAWYNLGNAYLIWGEFNDAIMAYRKAAELRPNEYSVWGCLGSAYHASGAFDKAVEAGSRALGLKADEPWVIGTLGLSKLLSGDAAGANVLFEQLLSLDAGGREIERIAAELKKTIAMRPTLVGANESLQKLNGGLIVPSSGPLSGPGTAQAS